MAERLTKKVGQSTKIVGMAEIDSILRMFATGERLHAKSER